MVEINDIFYKGSITLYLNVDEEVVGYAIIDTDRGYSSIELSNDITNIYLNKNILAKLSYGNKVYIFGGKAYLGRNSTEGPYCEEDIFLSFYDAQALSYDELLVNLDNNIKNNISRTKKLVKIGEYYK